MKTIIPLLLLLVGPSIAQAGPLHKVRRYISTHKELLAADVLLGADITADGASTVYVTDRCPSCIETNPLLGHHPSERSLWTLDVGYLVGLVTIEHLTWRYSPDRIYHHMIWMMVAPLTVEESVFTIPNNIRAGEDY
jgi:hypothetical protein